MNVWLRALLAVVVGNALWFVVLQPRLPAGMRHRPMAYDLGLLLDFILCLTLYVLLGRIRPRRESAQPPR